MITHPIWRLSGCKFAQNNPKANVFEYTGLHGFVIV